jgi:protein SPT2
VESYSSEIWKLFGKDRSKYVQQDVYSDDEDMEVGAGVLEREELRRSVISSPSRVTLLTKIPSVRASPKKRMKQPLSRRSVTRKKNVVRRRKGK